MPLYGTTPDATTSTKGKIQLAGDLAGTAAAPTIGAGKVTQAMLDTAAGGIGAAWASWTPSYSGITVGNGTVTAKYVQIGKTVSGLFKLVFGSTTSITTGYFSPPVTPGANYTAASSYIATGTGYDASATEGYPFYFRYESGPYFRPIAINTAGTYATSTGLSATIPFTWTTSDVLFCHFVYEAA